MTGQTWHVVPLSDLVEHDTVLPCVCGPLMRAMGEDLLVSHQPLVPMPVPGLVFR